MSDEKQPMLPARGRPPGIPQYAAGSKRSIQRLANLNFDPIGALVEQYRKLEKELEYQEKLRTGEIVELNGLGKPRAYRAEVHHALFDKMEKIGSSLLRYGYGRVPETDETGRSSGGGGLVVNLTRRGEQYVVKPLDELNDDLPD